MADRTVTVRLRATVDGYTASLKKAGADTSSFTRAVKGDFSKLSQDVDQLGKSMTKRVTLPLVAMGAAATKMATDFESVFSQMVGLAGVTADEVDGLRESVLELAGETGRAPQELAEALYFASSAGLDTAQAMAAVEMAAKAAAAGMGSAVDIVGLIASATASYGAGAIDAAEATDILTAAVKEGRADPREFAASLGSILPVAASLNVSFADAAGATAYLSNVFGDTARTVTSLGGIFAKLLTPTDQGREALEDMGTSVEELHQAIDSRGLLGAFELLRTKGFANNQAALRDLFDDVEAFRGAVALLEDRSGTLAETLDATANSAGAMERAFAAWGVTDAAQMAQAWQKIAAALIEFGAKLAPTIADVATFAAALVEAFSGLPSGLQLGLVAVAAALGPVLSGVSNVTRAFQTLGASGTVATAGITAGLSLLTFAWIGSQKAAAEHKQDVDDITKAYFDQGVALGELIPSVEKYLSEQSRFHDEGQLRQLAELGISFAELSAWLGEGEAGYARFVDALVEAGHGTEVFKDEMGRLVDGHGQLVDAAAATHEVNGRLFVMNDDLAKSYRELADHTEDASRKELDRVLSLDNLTDAQKDAILADLAATHSKTENTEVLKRWGPALEAAGIYVENLSSAQDHNTSTTDRQAAAMRELTAVFDSLFGAQFATNALDDAFSDWADAVTGAGTATARTGRQIDAVAEKQKAVASATKDAERAWDSYEQSLEGIEDATAAVTQAQADLDEALKGPSTDDKATAEDKLINARLSAEDANDAVADAQTDYNEAVAEFGPASDQARRALNDLRQAELRAKDAAKDAAKAQDELTAAQQWTAETAPEVAAAQDAVTEAQKRLDKATEAAKVRYGELMAAQQAQQDVQGASVASFGSADTAVSNHRDRVNELRDAYQRLVEMMKQEVEAKLTSQISGAQKRDELLAIRGRIEAMPFVNEQQRQDLLAYVDAALRSIPKGKQPTPTGGGWYPAAAGALVRGGRGGVRTLIGEAAHDEAVVPLTPSGVSTFLTGLDLRSVAATSGDTYTVNNTINLPPGSNGDDVVRAIKKYEKRNGSGWRRIA
jgi:TP901 family phage tail tape measure protein